MKIKEIHNLAIEMGVATDFRGVEAIKKILKRRREQYEKLSDKEKKDYDQSDFTNPYADSRILHIAEDKDVKKVLCGIDIEPAEILLAHELGDIDLVISHHPLGKGLARLSDVMELQCDVLSYYGVPINIAEGLMRERISEVARGLNAINHTRTQDTARLLDMNLMCLHTPCDNLAADFLRKEVEDKKPVRIKGILDFLDGIQEYKNAKQVGAGPKIFVGNKESRCGKIALTEITGGTSGSPKIYEKMAQAGIGTIIGMHMGKEHCEEAKSAFINVVIAGHMSSDSLGVNLFLDQLEKQGIEIVVCSGLIRVSRL